MAAEIVQGLFGVSPQSMKAQLDAQNQAQQMQLAQLNPEQQRFMMMGQGGRAAGQALGGLFGAQDPMMAANNQSNDLVGQVLSGLTPEQQQDPVAVHTAVYQAALASGNNEIANRALQGLTEAKTQQSKLNVDTSIINKNNQDVLTKQQEATREVQASKALTDLYAAKKAVGAIPTTEEIIAATSAFISAEKLTALLSRADSAKSAQQIQIDNATQRHEDKLAGITSQEARDKENRSFKEEMVRLAASLRAEGKKNNNVNYTTYDTLDEKLNDSSYGVNLGDIPARERTIARRISIDSREVTQGIDQILTLTNGGMDNVTGTTFSDVKGVGFMSATGKAFTNRISDKQSAMYDAMMFPLVKGIALYTNPDYRPNQADMLSALQAYKAGAGQPTEVQLAKLAELKKNYLSASEGYLDSYILNPGQAKSLKDQMKYVEKAIPWNVGDTTAYLKSGKSTTVSFESFLKSRKEAANKPQATTTTIPQAAIDRLKANPSLANDFNAHFGANSANTYLGKK
jgi:hypothetical protein